MALTDIINRIEADTAAEVESIRAAAQARADAIMAEATDTAEKTVAQARAAAQSAAAREADTLLVNARLRVRDAGVTARRALIGRVISEVEQRIAALPDADYVAFLAARIVAAARGGEVLHVGTADSGRASAVLDAVHAIAPGLAMTLAAEPAPFERGALLVGDRVRADLSLASIVNERRDELELAIAAELFRHED